MNKTILVADLIECIEVAAKIASPFDESNRMNVLIGALFGGLDRLDADAAAAFAKAIGAEYLLMAKQRG